jgi:hypothetical protein
MKQIIADSTQNTATHTRRWMLISFIAGLVFTAALVQSIETANAYDSSSIDSPGSLPGNESFTPAQMPDNNYLINSYYYRLVYTCPKGEARILV